jgi:YhcH/YjgK/YiaL family protein
MITDTLSNADLYCSTNSWLKKSFEYLKTISKDTPVGAYEIAPGLMAHVSEYETTPQFKYGWETHKKYIDIQFCLTGKEYIKWMPLSEKLSPTIEYDEAKDRTFYDCNGEQALITVKEDVFALFFPEDAHAPQIMIEKPEKVKKVVIKVPVE